LSLSFVFDAKRYTAAGPTKIHPRA